MTQPHKKHDVINMTPINDEARPDGKTLHETEGQCFAFSGAVGGTGVTSICIQTAFELTERSRSKTSAQFSRSAPRVCVIDLDFENGTCGHYLDLIPGIKNTDLQRDAAQIDKSLVTAFTRTHKSGIDLLAVENSLQGNKDANPDCVLAILDHALSLYDYIILDVPRLWQPWTHAAVAAANHFAIVTELTIPALHITRRRIAALEALVERDNPIDIILNKHERVSFKNSLRVSDAEQTLQREIFARLGLDTDTVRDAINWGIPVGTTRPDSRFAKDCRALTEQWMREISMRQVGG